MNELFTTINNLFCLLFFCLIVPNLSDDIHDIVVTWSTKQDTEESIVEYGIGGFILTEKGNSTLFVDGGEKKHKQYIHRVWLKNLSPSSKYGKHTNISVARCNVKKFSFHFNIKLKNI